MAQQAPTTSVPLPQSTAWSQSELNAAAAWSSEKEVTARKRDEARSAYEWAKDLYANNRKRDYAMPGVSPKLYEGNFSEWRERIRKQLLPKGLWHRVKYPMPPRKGIDEEEYDEREREDIWAVNIMLGEIDLNFLARQPIDRPVTGYDLLGKLERGAKPFRLMDLPRELRDRVYEAALAVPEDKRWLNFDTDEYQAFDENIKHRLDRRPKLALHIAEGYPPELVKHPPLLAVSRQLREEADPIYWSKNEWLVNLDAKEESEDGEQSFDPDLRTPMRDFQRWVNKVGMHRLKHLRDFTLGVEICPKRGRCPPEEFRLTLDEKTESLLLQLPGLRYVDFEIDREVMEWHMVAVNLRMLTNRWKDEAIIDLFLEPEFWDSWFFSYTSKAWTQEDAMADEELEEEKLDLDGKEWWTTCRRFECRPPLLGLM